MPSEALFDVVCTGLYKNERAPEEVITAFAQLAKIDFKKAKAIIEGKRAVKKSIAHAKAYQLKTRLEQIGLDVALQRVKKDPTAMGLSLEPIEEPQVSNATQPNDNSAPSLATLSLAPLESAPADVEPAETPLPSTEMRCPKCNLQQPKAQACSGCGVIVAKVAAFAETNESAQPQGRVLGVSAQKEEDETEEPVSTTKVILAASVAALVGALAWQFVAVTFNYELGFLAWGIGGLIGAAAVYYGAEGDNAGYLCGALALVAILGGKYLVASSFTEQYFEELQQMSSEVDLTEMADQMRAEAQKLQSALASDHALREYLVEYEYVYEDDPSEISQAVVDEHREDLELAYEDFEPMTDIYSGEDIERALGGFATSEVFKASFGWIDILFLLLGVSTAFRMASEGNIPFLRR